MSSPGTSASMGRVLLVCDDSAAIQQLAEGMQRLAIATEVCVDVNMALRLLSRKKFEAVIVDFGLEQADEMLEQVRLSPSNRTAVTFAITDPARPARFEIQPNFLMEKPLSTSFRRADLKSGFRIDRAGAAAFLSLSDRNSGRYPVQRRGSQLPSGEYQRGRNGHHGITLPEARSAGKSSVYAARRVGALQDRGRSLLVRRKGPRRSALTDDSIGTEIHAAVSGWPSNWRRTCRNRWRDNSGRNNALPASDRWRTSGLSGKAKYRKPAGYRGHLSFRTGNRPRSYVACSGCIPGTS